MKSPTTAEQGEQNIDKTMTPVRSTRQEVAMKEKGLVKDDISAEYWQNGTRRVWVISMFIGTMFLYAARSAVPLCIASMSKDLAWDKEADGAVMSAFFWGYTPAQIVGGFLSDKYGGELVLGYAAFIWSICTIVVPFLPAGPILFFPPIAVMVLSRVLTGLSQGLHYPSLTNIIVKRIPPRERSLLTGIVFPAGPVGTLLMGSVGSLILEYYSWPSVFILTGVVSILWAFIWGYYANRLYANNMELPKDKVKLITHETDSIKKAQIIVPYGLFMRHLGVWALIVAQFCHSAAFWNLFSWLPLYFEEVYPTSKKWVFNVLPWVVLFPCSTVTGLLAGHMIRSGRSVTFVRKLFQTISMCGAMCCMFLFDWVTTFNQAIFLIMVTMAFSSIANCGVVVTPQDMAPKFAGSLFGIMNAAGAFAGILVVPISGHILEITKLWSSLFHINAVLLIIGGVFFALFGTARKIV